MTSSTIDIAKHLISLKSVSPSDGGCHSYIINILEDLGFHIEYFDNEVASNFWAILYPDKKPDIVFAGHTDVVPPGDTEMWSVPPFTPEVIDGMLFGRGACDMKGSLAAMISASKEFINEKKTEDLDIPNIAFLITSAEEEYIDYGTSTLLDNLNPKYYPFKYCIVGEPTSESSIGDTIKVGRRGSITFNIDIHGQQGHVAYPEKAYNPNNDMIEFLQKLNSIEWDKESDLFKATNLEITHINSGVAKTNNVIPKSCSCQFNLRFSPLSSEVDIVTKIENILHDYVKCEHYLAYNCSAKPFISPPGQLVSIAQGAVKDNCGITPSVSTSGGTSDARFLRNFSNEIIELGLCNKTAHAIDEHVSVQDINKLHCIYKTILGNI